VPCAHAVTAPGAAVAVPRARTAAARPAARHPATDGHLVVFQLHARVGPDADGGAPVVFTRVAVAGVLLAIVGDGRLRRRRCAPCDL